MRKRVLFLGSALILFSFFYLLDPYHLLSSPTKPSDQVMGQVNPYSKYDPLIASYGQYFKSTLKKAGVPGAAIVIVKDTTILYMKGFGKRSLSKDQLVDEHTVFRIGSLSKGFTGVLSSKIAQLGYLNLSDKVVDALPEFELKDRIHTKQVALQDLLTHTSGLPYHAYTNLIEEGLAIETIMPELKSVNLIGPPGSVYAYQNLAFGISELIMEESTRQTFQALMEKQIFTPLGMTNASITHEAFTENDNHAIPHQYSRKKKQWYPTKVSTKYYNVPSAGGVNASISDMAQWIKHLLNDSSEVLSLETKASAFSPMVSTAIKNRYFRNWNNLESAHYGLGWRVLKFFDGQTIVHHGGYVNDFRSEIALNLDEKIGICILFNAPSSIANTCIPKFWDHLRIFSDTLSTPPGLDDNLVLELEKT